MFRHFSIKKEEKDVMVGSTAEVKCSSIMKGCNQWTSEVMFLHSSDTDKNADTCCSRIL